MKNLSKFAAIAGVTTAVAAFTLSPVMASSPGQLGGGPNIYKVKDVTQNGSYASSISAKACDVLEYSINLHNVNDGELSNIVVDATLPANGTSNITAVPDSGASAGTSGTVSVNLGSASGLTYEAGTTELYNGSGQPVKALPDGITNGGINVGDLNGSTGEFVNFKAEVDCPTPVTPTTPSAPAAPATAASTTLPQTGASDGLAGLAGTGGTGVIGYGVVMYRRSKKALANSLLNRK